MLAITASVAIRVFAVIQAPAAFQEDPDAYRAIAITLSQSGVFGLKDQQGIPSPTAFRPPLYPWLLSWGVTGEELPRVAVAGLHLLLAGLGSALVFLTTRQIVNEIRGQRDTVAGDRVALAAAMLATIDPILLRQSTEVMTETLAATLSIAAVCLLGRWINDDSVDTSAPDRQVWRTLGLPALIGCTLALAYLARPTFLVWAGLVVVFCFGTIRNRRRLVSGLIVAAIVAGAVGGWTWRNHRVFGHPIWATTHGGYTLLLANNESFYRYLSSGGWDAAWSVQKAWNADDFLTAYEHRYDADPRESQFWQRDWDTPVVRHAVSEVQDDRLCYEAAVATIKRHRKTFLWSMVVRVGRLWSPLPHDVAGRSRFAIAAVGCYYVTLYAAVLITVVRHRRVVFARRWWAIWLLAISLTVVHAVYWSNLRMRAPIMPCLAVLAATCVVSKNQSTPNSKTLRYAL